MGSIIFYLIIIAVVMVIKSQKKANGSGRSDHSAASTGYSRSSAAVNRTVSTLKSTAQKGVSDIRYRSTHADADYDDHLLDYCDSDLPSSGGITFKEIPKGVDELVYLRSFNRQREKALERELQSQESESINRING